MDKEAKELLERINNNVIQLSRLITLVISELGLSDYDVEEREEVEGPEPDNVSTSLLTFPLLNDSSVSVTYIG